MISKRMMSVCTWSIVCLLLFASQSLATYYTYEGYLSSGNGITATEPWSSSVTRLEWKITYDNSTTFAATGYAWLYEYELTVPDKNVSHFILEVSETFTMNDLCLVSGASASEDGATDYDVNSNGKSNPLMPGVIHGIKFEKPYTESAKHITLSFYSNRAPIWGDFYAKSGNNVVLYNTGFTANDVDPSVDPCNGSVNNHLLVPDTQSEVPEPSLLTLLSVGGLTLLRKRRG